MQWPANEWRVSAWARLSGLTHFLPFEDSCFEVARIPEASTTSRPLCQDRLSFLVTCEDRKPSFGSAVAGSVLSSVVSDLMATPGPSSCLEMRRRVGRCAGPAHAAHLLSMVPRPGITARRCGVAVAGFRSTVAQLLTMHRWFLGLRCQQAAPGGLDSLDVAAACLRPWSSRCDAKTATYGLPSQISR